MTKSKLTSKSKSKRALNPSTRKARRRFLLSDASGAQSPELAPDPVNEGTEPQQSQLSGSDHADATTQNAEIDDLAEVGLPDDHPAVLAFYDGSDDEEERVGYMLPPKKNQFQKGKSGNPSGKRNAPIIPPGTVISLIGKTVLEEISDMMRSPLRDLSISEDDNVATAFAKQIVADGVKKEGRSRTLLIGYYVEPQRTADRYQQRDQSAVDAKMLGELAQTILDPTITDEEITEKLGRWKRYKEDAELFKDGPLDELPHLPKPKKAHKKRKTSKRGSSRGRNQPTTQEPGGLNG
jgi:hypothetical protein